MLEHCDRLADHHFAIAWAQRFDASFKSKVGPHVCICSWGTVSTFP